MNRNFRFRTGLCASTAIAAFALALPQQVQAQGASSDGGLEEIVVTAQKREQSLQDVPIAITAVTQETLQANRIFSVNDLSSIAPGVTVKPSPGGSSVPVFTIRGQSSFGVVPGSDKQVSIYVDGVYISSPRGSIFELPDIQRLEVLRGPQGTLFGRNSTAGAISVTTRDPTGDAHVKVQASYGNRNAGRFRITADSPQIGPFSFLGSYVHDYRRGETYNAAGGQIWNRSLSPDGLGSQQSPYWLGTVDTDSYFGAVKFEPADNFKMVYKFDQNDDRGTPDVTGIIGFDPAAGGLVGAVPGVVNGLVGDLTSALYSTNNAFFAPSGKRPDIATNSFVVPRKQRVYGHSLTATWEPADHVTVKNIAAFRQSNVLGPSPIDGVSAVTFTQAAVDPFARFATVSALGASFFALTPAQQAGEIAQTRAFAQSQVGNRMILVAAQAGSISKQWSDELQVNYSSNKFDITIGGLWFHSRDEAGGPTGMQNTLAVSFIPQTGVIPLGNEGRYFNRATSIAAYAQVEYHISPQLEIVAGGRITRDEKSSSFRYDNNDGLGSHIITPPDYRKTKPNYSIGLNWTPNEDTLIYGKYSTSFVSGGTTGGLPYEPETASSWEVGAKADFLNHKLRTNLALFYVDYKHFQQSQSLSAPGSQALALAILTPLYGAATANDLLSKLSVFVGDQGSVRAKGFELEVTAAPTRGLTVGGSLSYTNISYPFVEPNVLAGNGGVLTVAARPEWTASANANYETEPLFGDATLAFRADGFFQSGMNMSSNYARDIGAYNINSAHVPGYWIVNGRVALRHLKSGPLNAELAAYGKNLTNRRDATTTLYTPFATSANYVPARTYGVELTIDF